MPFTLQIEIMGSCLFVPRSASGTDPNLMHVVMPVHAHAHTSNDRHVAVLAFDTAYLRQGSTGPDNIKALVPLRDLALRLDGTGANLTICPDVVNLKPVVQSEVIPDVLGADTGGRIVSRLTLAAGGMTAVAPGVCWKWDPGQVRRLAHRAQWTIGYTATPPLVLRFAGLHGASGRELRLYPLPTPDGDLLNLYFHHSPAIDLPPDPAQPVEPPPGTGAHHFKAYYPLFQAVAEERVPMYDSKAGCQPAGACKLLSFSGGSPYTCMIGGAWP